MKNKRKIRVVETCAGRELWEILVPTMRNDGRPIRTRYHRVWDKEIMTISGGMTILDPGKGRWIHRETEFKERMIPVRIMCNADEIRRVMDFTMEYYDQIAVMAYRVSDNVIVRQRDEERKK